MATNKRKDAAALFELIDKSTLKVPKNAGQLKIPTWWSSKTNPPSEVRAAALEESLPKESGEAPAEEVQPTLWNGTTEEATVEAMDGAGEPAPAVAAVVEMPNMAVSAPAKSVPTPVVTSAAVAKPTATPVAVPADEPADEPVVHVKPAIKSAASIRPPVRPAPVSPPPGPSRRSGVFAPATVDTRFTRSPANYPIANFPRWMVFGAGGALILLLVLMVWNFRPRGQDMSKLNATNPSRPITDPHGIKTDFVLKGTPTPRPTSPETPNRGANTVKNPDPGPVVITPRKGRVVPMAEIQRDAALLYLVIVTAKQDVAQANAAYLAENGIDVTVGRQKNGLFSVVSVDGFANRADPRTDALLRRVVELGRQHPAAKRSGRGVYDTAYFAKVAKPG